MSLNISMTIKSLNFIIYFHNSLINLYWTNFKYGVARVDTFERLDKRKASHHQNEIETREEFPEEIL